MSKLFYDRLPPDLQKAVLETGAKLEPEIAKWQLARIESDTKVWAEKGGKIVKLAPDEQQEAVRRASGATTDHTPSRVVAKSGSPLNYSSYEPAQGASPQGSR